MSLPEKIHRKELAELIGLTPRRIDQMSEDGVIPKSVDGMIDFKGAIQGLLNRKKENTTPAVERLNLAKAKREERKDRQESGDDIAAPVAIRATEGVHTITRERIMRVGNNVQSKLGLNEIQRKVIDEECRNALMELEKKVDFAKHLAETESDEAAITFLEKQND